MLRHLFLVIYFGSACGVSAADRVSFRLTDDWTPAEDRRADVFFNKLRRQLQGGTFDPRAAGVLRGSETATKALFNLPSLRYRQAITYQDGNSDNMVAAWSFEGPHGGGLAVVNHTPFLSEYAILSKDSDPRSAEKLADLLVALINWDAGNLGALIVDLPKNYPSATFFTGLPPAPRLSDVAVAFDFYADGALVGRDLYLSFRLGKRYTQSYNPVPPLIPERFPPLSELLTLWDSRRILGEVGRPAGPNANEDLSEDRDFMLLRELALRGLSEGDVIGLLRDAPDEKLYERARVVFRALHFAGHDKQIEQDFDSALDIYEEVGEPARQAAGELFRVAQQQTGCSANVEGAAIGLMKRGVFYDSAISYLDNCSESAEAIQLVDRANVPSWLAPSKVAALRSMKRRLASQGIALADRARISSTIRLSVTSVRSACRIESAITHAKRP